MLVMVFLVYNVVVDSIWCFGCVGFEFVSKVVGCILFVIGMVGIWFYGIVKVEWGVVFGYEGVVDGDLVEVDIDVVILGVFVEEYVELEKWVGWIFNVGNYVVGGEGGLFDVVGEVFGIFVEDEVVKFFEWELVFGLDFGYVKGVKVEKVGVGLFGLYYLDVGSLFNFFVGFNGVLEVMFGIIWIMVVYGNSFGIGKLFLVVFGEEGVFDVYEFIFFVDLFECVVVVVMVVLLVNRSVVVWEEYEVGMIGFGCVG